MLKPPSLIQETAAVGPTPEVHLTSPLDHTSFSRSLQLEAPSSTILSSTFTALSTLVPSSLVTPSISYFITPPIVCGTDNLYSCQSQYTMRCRCDVQCAQFGDCCFDSNHVQKTHIPNFACVSNFVMNEKKNEDAVLGELHYHWMIASCPRNEPDTETMCRVSHLCEAQSLSTPPITDNRTGLVYRNKYCAQCHGVPDIGRVTCTVTFILIYHYIRCAHIYTPNSLPTQQLLLKQLCVS